MVENVLEDDSKRSRIIDDSDIPLIDADIDTVTTNDIQRTGSDSSPFKWSSDQQRNTLDLDKYQLTVKSYASIGLGVSDGRKIFVRKVDTTANDEENDNDDHFLTINISDHLPVSCSFNTTIKPSIGPSNVRKWRKKSDWKKINIDEYQSVCDEMMGRIKVPYHLLQANPSLETTEKQIDLNVYCMEIIHALRVAGSAAVPQRRVRIGTEVPHWKENPFLAQLCHASKFWHKMGMDIEKPRSGAKNTVRIYLKRKFAKCLQKHNATILDENSNALKSEPNAVRNFLKRKKRSDCDGPSLWPEEEQWNNYYKIEFTAPDAQLVSKYEDNLDLLLSEASPSLGFV
ncbi:hypothetical protein QYM36_012645, partial [Artemia franciscana]